MTFDEWIARGQSEDPDWFWTVSYIEDMRKCWNAATESVHEQLRDVAEECARIVENGIPSQIPRPDLAAAIRSAFLEPKP